jgi:hypothetical protein
MRGAAEGRSSAAEQCGPLSFVLVSGDIAYSGQLDEYVQGAGFMSKLSAQLSIDRRGSSSSLATMTSTARYTILRRSERNRFCVARPPSTKCLATGRG